MTDTGDVRDMLDLARRRWPEESDRRRLLLKLASAGAEQVAAQMDAEDDASRQRRQRAALARAGQLVDLETLLSEASWG